MDQGAKDYMDVPDSMGQRNDTVALEEDHAKLQISGVWGSLKNQMCEVPDMNQWTWKKTYMKYILFQMCNNIPNKRRRLLEALIIQKHHSERKQGYITTFKIYWFCANMIFPMPYLSMAAVEIHSIENHPSYQCRVVECIVYSNTSAKAQDILFEDKTF